MYSKLVQWESADCSNIVGVVVSLMTVCDTRRDSACSQILIVTLSPIIIPVLYSILVQWEGVDCSNVVSLMTVCVTRRDSACCQLLIVTLSPL